MLLRRMMLHLKDQNWLAVGLDLVIVVFGVWLAFQITEWSEQRNQRAETREQLFALQTDLIENLDRLNTHLDYTQRMIQDLVKIRESLVGSAASTDMDVLRGLLGKVFTYDYFEPELGAYEVLQNSGNLRTIRGTPIGNSISGWQGDVAALMRDQSVMIDNRNRLTATLIATDYSLASTLDTWLHPILPPSNFNNSFEELAGNKVLDDALSVHVVLRNSNRMHVEATIESTEILHDQIQSFLEN